MVKQHKYLIFLSPLKHDISETKTLAIPFRYKNFYTIGKIFTGLNTHVNYFVIARAIHSPIVGYCVLLHSSLEC